MSAHPPGRIYDGLNCARLDRAQLERTLAGGIFGFNLTIVRPPHDFETAMADLAPRLDFIEANADLCAIARSVAEIEAVRASGRVAIVMGAQNSVLVENDPTLLGILKRLGFRILQPTYMEKNKLGCGVVADPDTGLTEQGRKWVAEMNRLALVIDLSHVGYRTAADVIAASKQPVIVSHGNARALCDSPRNLPDALIKAVADKGGVVGATFFSPILRRDRRPTIEDWCDHVVHMTSVAGRDNIGFATDLSEGSYRDAEHWDRMFGPNGLYPTVTGGLGPWFNFADRFPSDFQSVAKGGDVWDALRRRQFSETEVEKLMAGNMLRAYRDIWGGDLGGRDTHPLPMGEGAPRSGAGEGPDGSDKAVASAPRSILDRPVPHPAASRPPSPTGRGESRPPVLRVENLSTHLTTRAGTIRAVDGVSFTVAAGETLGIVGESGCGKSMTALSIMGLLPRPIGRIAGGAVELAGHGDLTRLPPASLRRLRGSAVSMIFQEPMTSLNPVFTVGRQIVEAIRLHTDLSPRSARERAIEMLRLVRIPLPETRIDAYPHQLSGGMRQRVMIAMALSCRPQVMLADEPTTALDVTIQAQILALMNDLKREVGTAIVLITHDLGVIARMAARVVVMYAGAVVEEADVRALFSDPLHPYTEGLLRSIPRVDRAVGRKARLDSIPGTVPNLAALPRGCRFQARCPAVHDRCRVEEPPLAAPADRPATGRRVRCWLHPPRSGELRSPVASEARHSMGAPPYAGHA